MFYRKLLPILAALLLAFTGCSTASSNESAAPSDTEAVELSQTEEPTPEIDGEPSREEAAPEPAENGGEFVFSDEYVNITITFDQESYSLDSVINSQVTVTNIGEQTVIYVVGSGSNRVPDGLVLDLGGLVGLFYPEVMTMDYGMGQLEPGDTVEFDCPYVPYLAEDGVKGYGFDKDLAYFRAEGFESAQPGTVEGSLRFSYSLAESSDDPADLFLQSGDDHVLEGTYSTVLQ